MTKEQGEARQREIEQGVHQVFQRFDRGVCDLCHKSTSALVQVNMHQFCPTCYDVIKEAFDEETAT
jgi:hypothetical protein